MQIVVQFLIPVAGNHLFLNGKSGIEECAFVEVGLFRPLHLHHKAGPVDIDAFHVENRIVTPFESIPFAHSLTVIFDINDIPLRNQLAEDIQQDLLVLLGAENLFEPFVNKDIDVSADRVVRELLDLRGVQDAYGGFSKDGPVENRLVISVLIVVHNHKFINSLTL